MFWARTDYIGITTDTNAQFQVYTLQTAWSSLWGWNVFSNITANSIRMQVMSTFLWTSMTHISSHSTGVSIPCRNEEIRSWSWREVTIITRVSLIVADAIALTVTWYKLGARKTSVVTSTSFSRILLRDGKIWRLNLYQSIKTSIQDQYTSGTPEWETSHFALAISDTLRQHTVHSELFAPYIHTAFRT